MTCLLKDLCDDIHYRLFGNSGACRACSKSIPANEMVMRAQGNVFHVKVIYSIKLTYLMVNHK